MSTKRQARFEEGTSVDVVEYLRSHGNPEAAEKWEQMNEEYGDMLKTAKIPLKQNAGTRVVVNANPASRALYSGGLPADGTEGTVTPVSFGSTKRTWMAGPGGGLIYVKFDDGTFLGVSSIDLDKAPAKKKANMKKWDPRFFGPADGKTFGDRRFNYVPFHQLSPQDQSAARRQYPHKSVGAMYDFIDEHYLYPIDRTGQLGRARRVLAIPLKLIQDADFMASLGYTMNPGWPKTGAVNWKEACGDELMGRFEEGQSADPTENMSPEDKKRWWDEHAKNKDNFKAAVHNFRRKLATVRRAMEHPSDEARKKYLQDHPGADPKNHTVKKDEGGKGEKKDEGGDSKPVSMSREGYKAIADSLAGFEGKGSWTHVITYANSGRPMDSKHVKDVVKDIDGYLKNWKQVSEANGWGPKDKKNLTRAKGILENWSGGGGKQANEFTELLAEGCPDNLDESECNEWELNTLKYKDVVKDKQALDELAALDLDLTELAMPGVVLDRSLRAMEHVALTADIDRTANSMVGQVILQQMGGLRRLSAMLGIYYLQYLPNGVEFGWPSRTPSKGNHVRVILLPSDTYRVEFFKTSWTDLGRGAKIPAQSKLVKKLDDIYADSLVEIFENQTGWYLRLASADADALIELRALTADFEGEKRTDDGWEPGHMVSNPKAVESTEGSETPDGEGNKAKRAFSTIDMMWALVSPDHYVLGATDNHGDARSKSYWRAFVDDEQVDDAQILTLENVPEPIAEKLMDLGTPAQRYDDGYEAWRDVKPHVTGRPVRLAAEDTSKEAAGGLYGHTRRVQSDCEACIRKVQRTANSIAKRIYGKDQRVSQFLSTHAKRANSLSAKILIAGMEGLGPKFASADPEALRKQARLADLRARRTGAYRPQELREMEDLLKQYGYDPAGAKVLQKDDIGPFELEHRLKSTRPGGVGSLEYTHNLKRLAKLSDSDAQSDKGIEETKKEAFSGPEKTGRNWKMISDARGKRWIWSGDVNVPSFPGGGLLAFHVQEFEGPGIPLYRIGVILPDGTTLKYKRQVKTPEAAFNVASMYYKALTDENVIGLDLSREWAAGMFQKMAMDITAGAPEHGLYGFTDKTATLGLNACAELRAAAGRITADLHRRRADRHESITGFLKEHCKQAKCMYARILSDSYPDKEAKTASAPKSVAEWVAFTI